MKVKAMRSERDVSQMTDVASCVQAIKQLRSELDDRIAEVGRLNIELREARRENKEILAAMAGGTDA